MSRSSSAGIARGRPRTRATGTIASVGCLLALLVSAPASGAERPPNVVLIMADDVGFECFGAYGSAQYRTPRIDRLADSGVRFTNCYATPLCTPSRVALMTGLSNVRNYADFGALLPDQFTMAKAFSDSGYVTAVAGKWQLQGGTNAAGVPAGDGFDTYCLWNTAKTGRSRYWNPSIECDGSIVEAGEDAYGPDLVVDFLLRFIEDNRDRPFFAYYPMILPHSPFDPTPHSTDRGSEDEQRNFEDMVAYTDHLVGRLHDKLESLGLLRQTIFVFTADNGSHNRLTSSLSGSRIRGDKGAPTDAGTHVPLIVSAPGLVSGGRVLDDLIDFTDFLPTLSDAASLQLPDDLATDGVSFWDRLQGRPGKPREWLFTYYFPRPYATDSFSTPYTHPEVVYVRDKRYKLYGGGDLFDVRSDPDERHPFDPADDGTREVRRKLERALGSMPRQGLQVPLDRSRASSAAARPRWERD